MTHVGDGPIGDIAATEAMLRDYIAHHQAHGSSWAMVERDSGDLIGDAGLYILDGRGPGDRARHTLGRTCWGKGYATEAAVALLAAAFDEVGLDEVVAVADAANAASKRVLEQTGMRCVGTREAYGRPHAVYIVKRSGWRANSPAHASEQK
jgi:RimJ/RimL family protein N-acetyltransferase